MGAPVSCDLPPLSFADAVLLLWLSDEDLFTTNASLRSVSVGEWREFVQTAWSVDPRLAVRLAERFPAAKPVKQALRELLRASPEHAYHVPEAVEYLVTEEAVATSSGPSGASELQHLIYWRPSSISLALKFLMPPFCYSRVVVEYAVHTLRSHPISRVLFFLPQIIQLLHFDKDGLVR